MDCEKHPATATPRPCPATPPPRFRLHLHKLAMAVLLSVLYLLLFDPARLFRNPTPDFSHLASHCAHVQPIPADSFVARQDTLARTLHELGAAAYIAEPGANAAFYANLSGSAWHLSERPLLFILTPSADDNNRIVANISVLTPSFEATRAKLLPLPSAADVTYPEWPEDADPYQVAVSAIPGLKSGTIFIDGAMRTFVADGLQKAVGGGHKVVSAPVEVKRLRERKSTEEIEIMKCANEVTLLSIRAAAEEMYIGIHESEARALVANALTSAGLKDVSVISLFGPNAALPHGSGTDRTLAKEDFVLVDCGGSLHGYVSDVTRTFALEDSRIPAEHLDIWMLVWEAQGIALATAFNGTITADVDRAARVTIETGGYGKYFTHRLGHGIGLEGHESPYLRGGSDDIILTGHSFSDEPGVYIEGKVGVRLEDCFYIDEYGRPVLLTAGVGAPSTTPWDI